MLQLLLERGQSYADLASVLGVDEAEVRARARAALTEIAGTDPDRNVGLTDYLLGQADPIGRADVVRHLKDDPDDLALATELSQKLRLLAPQAELPRLPGEERRPGPRRRPTLPTSRLRLPQRLRRTPPPAEDEGAATDGPPARTTLTQRQIQIMVALGCGAVLIAVIALGIAGVFSGGESSGSTTGSTTGSTASTPTQDLARVQLSPQGGASGSGSVNFGLANGQQPFADVRLRGLKPAPANQTYVIWLLLTPDQGYPLSPFAVSKNGTYINRFPIPAPIIPVIARVQLVNVSLAPVGQVRKSIESAIQQRKIIINRPGTSVLQGAIPKSSSAGG
jgi:hypothetical protein